MANRGQIENEPKMIRKQAEELMGYNDEAFVSMSRWVARQPTITKQAFNGAIPKVGLTETNYIQAAQDFESSLAPSQNLVEKYSELFSSRSRR